MSKLDVLVVQENGEEKEAQSGTKEEGVGKLGGPFRWLWHGNRLEAIMSVEAWNFLVDLT